MRDIQDVIDQLKDITCADFLLARELCNEIHACIFGKDIQCIPDGCHDCDMDFAEALIDLFESFKKKEAE